jgi:hypothetical protein
MTALLAALATHETATTPRNTRAVRLLSCDAPSMAFTHLDHVNLGQSERLMSDQRRVDVKPAQHPQQRHLFPASF